MIIHVVQEGETINFVAEKYGISAERLMLENGIQSPDRVAVGEALIIIYPEITHTVEEGDTLIGIADYYGVTVMQLLRNNPYLSNREFIYPGETIVISYENNKIAKLSTNGYAYPFIEKEVLIKTLPFLTYLTVYSYTVTAEGEIYNIDDAEIIQTAWQYGVAPIMMLVAVSQNQIEEINVTRNVLANPEKQNQFIDDVISILKVKGYYGVNINTPYVFPQDLNKYVDFIVNFSSRIQSEGFKVFVTLSIGVFEIISGAEHIGLDYARLAEAVDVIMYMPYEWGNVFGISTALLSFEAANNYLDNMTKEIPPEKTMYGVPLLGYQWELPYISCISKGLAITNNTALKIAREVGAMIQFDDTTKVSYFQYSSNNEYLIRFRDARSIDAYLQFVPKYGFYGCGFWNIMSYFPQLWMIVNTQYEIDKLYF